MSLGVVKVLRAGVSGAEHGSGATVGTGRTVLVIPYHAQPTVPVKSQCFKSALLRMDHEDV
jgi:hypothetical protein